jgi:hypothetical protein
MLMTPGADRIDRSGSLAVLIGVSDYQDRSFPSVPAAKNSLSGMHRMLADEDLGGWPRDRVIPMRNPVDCRRVMSDLRRHAQSTTGVLLLYFVGHGTVTANGDLVLAVSDTVADEPDVTGLEYSKIRGVLLGSPAKVKAVVLDCCYSGRAIDMLAGDRQVLADITDIRGTYTLTAADRAAHAGKADTSTAFTGELLDVISTGIAGGPPILTFAELYPHLRQRLIARNLPHPNQRGTDTADRCPVARNVSGNPSPTSHDRDSQDVSAVRQETKTAPTPPTTMGQPSSPHTKTSDVPQKPPKPDAPFTISWTGKDPLSAYTDSSHKGFLVGLAKVLLPVTAPGVLIPLLLHRIKVGTGQEDGWMAWFVLSTVFGLFTLGFLLVLPVLTYLHRTRKGWSLSVGPEYIETTSHFGTRKYLWRQVLECTIEGIVTNFWVLHEFTGLHLKFTKDVDRKRGTDPAGWSPNCPGERTIRGDGAWPICVLGPMTEKQRSELDEAIARYGPPR